MDNLTMAVMSMIINIAYFVLFLFLWILRRDRALGFFAGAFGAAVAATLGLTLQNTALGNAGIIALNIGLYLFYALITGGFLYLHQGSRHHFRVWGYALASSLLILYFTIISFNFEIRGYVSHGVLILIMLEFMYKLRRRKEGLPQGELMFLRALAVANILIYILMTSVLISGEGPAQKIGRAHV